MSDPYNHSFMEMKLWDSNTHRQTHRSTYIVLTSPYYYQVLYQYVCVRTAITANMTLLCHKTVSVRLSRCFYSRLWLSARITKFYILQKAYHAQLPTCLKKTLMRHSSYWWKYATWRLHPVSRGKTRLCMAQQCAVVCSGHDHPATCLHSLHSQHRLLV